MGKKSPKPPAPPDPFATAQAQSQANKDAAIAQSQLNMVNQYGPSGSIEYSERGNSAQGVPQYSVTTKLSPEQQRIYDLEQQASERFGQIGNKQLQNIDTVLSKPIDYNQFGAQPVVNEQTRQNAREAIIGRNRDQMDRDRANLEARLASKGISAGSQAYNDEFDKYNKSVNDFRLAADQRAGDEMQRVYGLERQQRDAAINELIQQRQIPINEISALLSGSQVQGPQFLNTPQSQINPANLEGAINANYQGQLANYQAQLQRRSQGLGALGSLLGQGLGAAGFFFGNR